MIHEDTLPTVLPLPMLTGRRGRGERTTLDLVTRLCAALERSEVRYCHWKSNLALDRSASGENDLDLLVAADGIGRFTSVLHELGFKEALEPARRRFPGIRHFFGLDEPSGRLVNVHAHYRLVIGDDATKNYRLPIEEPYLATVTRDAPFMVPEPEFEFVVFVIRMMLKHGTWDATLGLRGRLSETESQELAYLSSRVDVPRVDAIVRHYLPFIDGGLFRRCIRALEPTSSNPVRMRAARELHRSLAACARRPRGVDAVSRLWRRGSNRLLKIVFRRTLRNRLAAGGAMVAVVGGDGAGKSTVVEELHAWLSSHFLVRTVHLGKPPRSAASLLVKSFLRLRRSLGLAHPEPQGSEARARGVAQVIWHTLTARDRYRAYVLARRIVSGGGIVVCDRYSLPVVTIMDGPRVGPFEKGERGGRLVRFLGRIERRFYDRIAEPDVLVVLAIDPDVAVRRRSDDDEVVVRARSTAILGTDWTGISACVFDANDPLPEVTIAVKSMVWSRL